MGPIVELNQIAVERGGQPVLKDATFRLESGKSIGIAGPNGSGKTSLLRLVATLLTPAAGTGKVLGARLGTQDVHEVRSEIGLISHTPSVIGQLSQRENLQHVARLSGADESKIEQVLRVVGLDEAAHRKAEASSFGMLRRVEVARLLLTRPQLLLLDEPFSGLDSQAQDLIGALIHRTTASGGSAVLVSHDAAQLEESVDSVLVLNSGKLEGQR